MLYLSQNASHKGRIYVTASSVLYRKPGEVEETEKDPFLNNTLWRGSDGTSHFMSGNSKRWLDQKIIITVGDLEEGP